MAALPISIFAILLTFYSFKFSPAAVARLIAGGWKPIKDLADPEVVRVANFAVTEHNRHPNNLKLKFVRIVRGETQVVSGLNYMLVIAGHYVNKSMPYNFETVVYEKAGGQALKLVSFYELPPESN